MRLTCTEEMKEEERGERGDGGSQDGKQASGVEVVLKNERIMSD